MSSLDVGHVFDGHRAVAMHFADIIHSSVIVVSHLVFRCLSGGALHCMERWRNVLCHMKCPSGVTRAMVLGPVNCDMACSSDGLLCLCFNTVGSSRYMDRGKLIISREWNSKLF